MSDHDAVFGGPLGARVPGLERIQAGHGQAFDVASGTIGPAVGICLTDSDEVAHRLSMTASQARTLAGVALDTARAAEAEAGITVTDGCPSCTVLHDEHTKLVGLLDRLSPARVRTALSAAAGGADVDAVLARLAAGAAL